MIPSEGKPLAGRTVLITGATSGIGLEASVVLAAAGADLVIVGRDASRTARALEEITRRSGSAQVEPLLGDLSSQASVRQLAADFRARRPHLHVLINNAGGVNAKRKLTVDGIEATFAVNHLGPFLLTGLLSDLLTSSAPARVVNVASASHYRGTLDLDDLGFEKGYQVMRAYGRSKLGNVMFTLELSRRLQGAGVTVNALHPGVVATNIWSNAPVWVKPLLALVARLFMLTPAEGAKTITYLSMSPEVEGKTGLYFTDNQPKPPARLARDEVLAQKLWAESARLVGLPG